MSVEILTGNIFTSKCQTLVNTINCEGVMGAGIALECRLRYPSMFKRYKELCNRRMLKPGVLWLYKASLAFFDINEKWILNFPTKIHWRNPSQLEWIVLGLDKFMSVYREKGISSIAFPVLGSLNGGLNPQEVISIMTEKLEACEIPVEIYQYQADAPDDLFEQFKCLFMNTDVADIAKVSGMRMDMIKRIKEAIGSLTIHQLNQLARFDGIGAKTLEKAFGIMRLAIPKQMELQL